MSSLTASISSSVDWDDIRIMDRIVEKCVKPLLVGTFLSCALLGIIVCLSWRYFSLFFHHDRPVFIFLVLLSLSLAILDTVFDCLWALDWAVHDWGQAEEVVKMPRWVGAFGLITSLAGALTQCFYAWRVWVISQKRNWPIVSLIGSAALAAGGLGLACSAHYFRVPYLRDFFSAWPAIMAHFIITAVVDVAITASVIWYLVVEPKREGRGLVEANFQFRRLARRAIQSNAAALIVQGTLMGLILGRRSGAEWTIVALLQGKVYLASLIASLASRPSPQTSDSYTTRGTGVGVDPPSLSLPIFLSPSLTATGITTMPALTTRWGASPFLAPVPVTILPSSPPMEGSEKRGGGRGEDCRKGQTADAGLGGEREGEGEGGKVRVLFRREDGTEVEMGSGMEMGTRELLAREEEDKETALSAERRHRARGGRGRRGGGGGNERGKESE